MKTYKLALEMVRQVAAINRRIERRDGDLARQLRRASMSVPLNINEGMYSRGKNRSARLTDAMASAKESVACLEVAVAVGYLDEDAITCALTQLDRIVGSLWNMVHRPWRWPHDHFVQCRPYRPLLRQWAPHRAARIWTRWRAEPAVASA